MNDLPPAEAAAEIELLRRILEEDPPTPSVHWTRLNLEETRRRAQERRTDPTALLSN